MGTFFFKYSYIRCVVAHIGASILNVFLYIILVILKVCSLSSQHDFFLHAGPFNSKPRECIESINGALRLKRAGPALNHQSLALAFPLFTSHLAAEATGHV